jgi:hypothetical protein
MNNYRDEHPDYQSYMLRLWRTQSGATPVWRVALEEPLTQEVLRFDDLSSLFAFLQAQTGQGPASDSQDRIPPPVHP